MFKQIRTPQYSVDANTALVGKIADEPVTLVGVVAAFNAPRIEMNPHCVSVYTPGNTICCGATHYHLSIFSVQELTALVLQYPKTMMIFSCGYGIQYRGYCQPDGSWANPATLHELLEHVCKQLNKEKSGIKFQMEPIDKLQSLMVLRTELDFGPFNKAIETLRKKFGVK